MGRNSQKIKATALSALFCAIVVFCSWLSFPTPFGVAITLQTFAVCLAGRILKPLSALGCILTYLIIGAAGLPVFSSFGGGMGIVLGPSGGFLLGFIPLGFLSSLSNRREGILLQVLLSFSGVFICHICGVVWFKSVSGVTFLSAVLATSIPFILKDFICAFAAIFISRLKIVKKLII